MMDGFRSAMISSCRLFSVFLEIMTLIMRKESSFFLFVFKQLLFVMMVRGPFFSPLLPVTLYILSPR